MIFLLQVMLFKSKIYADDTTLVCDINLEFSANE